MYKGEGGGVPSFRKYWAKQLTFLKIILFKKLKLQNFPEWVLWKLKKFDSAGDAALYTLRIYVKNIFI